jgi:hypothetical protein
LSQSVLKVLCDRIAKQERRHFAWYYNKAKQELEKSDGAKTFARQAMKHHWTPVGAGVKSPEEVFRLFSLLFPGPVGLKLVADIDAKIAALPGLGQMNLMENYFTKAKAQFEVPEIEDSTESQAAWVSEKIS